MADGRIETSIFIKDEFSEPLDGLCEGLEGAQEDAETFQSDLDRLGDNVSSLEQMSTSAYKLSDRFGALVDGLTKFANAACKAFGTVKMAIDKFNDATRITTKDIKSRVGELQAKAEKYRNAWEKSNEVQERYLGSRAGQNFELTKRNAALFGPQAEAVSEMYAKFADENGWAIGEAVSSALKANRVGVGSNEAMGMLQNADMFAMINGSSLQDTFDALLQSVEGHSASSVANLMGGGQGVERALQRQGYERALKTGNVQKAMDILKKVAVQFGYTAEAATKASKTASVQAGILMQRMTNAADRIKGAFIKSIEPSLAFFIEQLTKVFEREDTQAVLAHIEKAVVFIGKALGSIIVFFGKLIEGANLFGKSFVGLYTKLIGMKLILKGIIGMVVRSLVFGFIKKLIARIPFLAAAIKKLGALIWTGVKKVAGFLLRIIGGALKKLALMILRHPMMLIGTLVMVGLDMAVDAFSGFYQEVTGGGSGFIENLIGMTAYGVGFFGGILKLGCMEIANAFIGAYNSFSEFATSMENGIRSGLNSVYDFLVDIVVSIAKKLEEVFRMFNMDELANEVAIFTNGVDGEVSKNLKLNMVKADAPVEKFDTSGVDPKKMAVDLMKENAQFYKPLYEKLDGFKSFIGFEHNKDREAMGSIANDTGKIRGMMTEEQEVAWLKELGERQYINKLNVESPKNTFNIAIKTGKDMNAADMRKEMERMVESQRNSGGFGVSINQRLQPA